MSERYTGFVHRLTPSGYGFLVADDGNQVFMHRSDTLTPFGELRVGDRCEFSIDPGTGNGPRAVDVQVVEAAPDDRVFGEIAILKEAYGFAKVNGDLTFFAGSDLYGFHFDMLQLGQVVSGRLVSGGVKKHNRLVEVRIGE
jgi:cold shock CspA family protein